MAKSIHVLRLDVGILFLELLQEIILRQQSHLLRFGLDHLVNRFFLRAVIFGRRQAFAKIRQPLLGHILLVTHIDNRVLPFIADQGLL